MLIFKEDNDDFILGVWKIEESISDFLLMLGKSYEVDTILQTTSSEKRLKEQLATRVLLESLLGNKNIKLFYHASGKPYLQNFNFHISISHTNGYAAIVLGKIFPFGIDIEVLSDRVKRIRSKFINQREYIDTTNELLHLLLHWTAKECIFKIADNELLSLKNNIIIEKFEPISTPIFYGELSGIEQKGRFRIQYQANNNYILSLATSVN